MDQKENVTEKRKTESQMLWVQKMNHIRSRGMKMVKSELVFTIQAQQRHGKIHTDKSTNNPYSSSYLKHISIVSAILICYTCNKKE